MVDQLLSDLREARKYLAETGWHQGGYVPEIEKLWDGQPACMGGALAIVIMPGSLGSGGSMTPSGARYWSAFSRLTQATPRYSVSVFNDQIAVRVEDALAIYDRAIATRERYLKSRTLGQIGE